jgi:hypothetical protein
LSPVERREPAKENTMSRTHRIIAAVITAAALAAGIGAAAAASAGASVTATHYYEAPPVR